MKTKYLFAIATLFGLSLVPALPSYSQPNNPCKLAPFATPSRETRQIRVENFGIAFNIPANYRTRSDIKEDFIFIRIYNPSSFSYSECLQKNNIQEPPDRYLSGSIYISQTEKSLSLSDISKSQALGYIVRNMYNSRIADQPALSYEFNYEREGTFFQRFLFFIPSTKYLVSITYDTASNDGRNLFDIIKSSFNFNQ